MSMFHYGDGSSGVALLVNSARDSEYFAGEPLRSFVPVWKAQQKGIRREDLLLISLGLERKTPAVERTAAVAKALELCARKNIRVIMPVSGALKHVTKLSGNAQKMIGTTWHEGGRWIIPLDSDRHGGRRATRSHMWNLVQAGFIARAVQLAAGSIKLYQPQRKLIGVTNETRVILHELLASPQPCGVDLETCGTDHRRPTITAFGIGTKDVSISIPWHGYDSKLYGPQAGLDDYGGLGAETRALVVALLRSHLHTLLFHNGAFDLTVLRGHGLNVAARTEDTILAHRVIYPDLYHNLQFCAAHRYAVDPWKTRFEVFRKERGEPREDWAEVVPRELQEYNAGDAGMECPLWEWLNYQLDSRPFLREQYAILKELAAFSAEVRWHGVEIDTDQTAVLTGALEKRLAEMHAEWAALTDNTPFSGEGSKAAVNRLFFETLRAPVLKRSGDTGEPSLAASVLLDYDAPTQPNERLANVAFLKFRISKAEKARTAFLVPLAGVNRVYPILNFGGTKGTRASCQEPNLQQWSKPKETRRPRTGKEIKLAPPLRKVIRADRGWILVESDANALELRLVAYAARIPDWIDWLASGVDMHIKHVEQMFGVKVTKKNDPDNLREITKTLTYARFYNDKASVGTVLAALKPKMPTLTEEFLKDVFKRFDKARPEIVAWQKLLQAQIDEHGYVETGMGRWRQIHDRRSPDLNQAYSFTIQSTGGAFMNAGMLRLLKRLDSEKMRVLFQVHDSLVCQARPEYVRELVAMIHEEMERPVDLWDACGVVIPFETKVGINWHEMYSLKDWETRYWPSVED